MPETTQAKDIEVLNGLEDQMLAKLNELRGRWVLEQSSAGSWFAVARASIQQGFMSARRGVYNGERIGRSDS